MRADTMRAALVLALSTIYAAAVHPKGAAFSARGGVRATSASCPAPPGGTAARGGDAGVVVVDGFLAPDDVARLRAQTGWLDASFLGLRPNTTPERHFVVDAAPAVAARLRSAVYAALGSVDDGSAPAQTRLPARTILLAPLVAYPTTQDIKPVDDTNDESRPESERRACAAAKRVSLLVSSSSIEYGKEQVYHSSLSTGTRGGQGIYQPFAAWCRSMRSKADRASWAVYSWSGSRQ